MENQPMPPAEPQTSPTLTDQAPVTPTEPTATPTAAAEPTTKKKKTGLIISIIIAILVLLGGSFTAFVMVRRQPANMALSALSNLIGAERLNVTGEVSFMFEDDYEYVSAYQLFGRGVKGIKLNLSNQVASGNLANSTTSKLIFFDGEEMDLLRVEDSFIKDGVIYFKVSGVGDLYEKVLEYIKDSYDDELVVIPDDIYDLAEEIVGMVDNQWIRISLDEILDSDLFSALPNEQKESAKKARDCLLGTFEDSKTATELKNIYSANQFLKLTPTANSFYDVSISAKETASFANSVMRADYVKNTAVCMDMEYDPSDLAQISASDIEDALEDMPNIAVKIDGFLDYHLTDLVINKSTDAYTTSLNFTFEYPNNLTLSAPADATPIMDLVEKVYTKISDYLIGFYSDYSDLYDYDYEYDDEDYYF